MRQAETQLADARRRHAELGAEQISRSLTHEWRISGLEALLRAGAPEFLDRFLMDLDVLTDETRLQFKVLKSVAGLRDDLTGALPRSRHRDERRERGAAFPRHRGRPGPRRREMKLEPELAEEAVKTTLRELLAGLPAVESPLRETGPIFTPAELREAEWRREEAKR